MKTKLLLILYCLTLQASDVSYVTCAIQSQLGNQLFEISTALATAWEHGAVPVFPELNRTDFNIPLNRKKIFFRLNDEAPPDIQWNYFRLNGLHLNVNLYYQPVQYAPNLYIEGWNWMTCYFDSYKNQLIEIFAPSEDEERAIQEKYGDLLSHKNVVAVHVRACDPRCWEFLGFEYTKKAMDLFPEDTTFAIFSCRIEFTKKHLAGYKPNIVFIENNDHVRDFFLMNKCKHHVISNSSYSWWAAYLKDDPEQIVIAPDIHRPSFERFTNKNGAYPENWIVFDIDLEDGKQYDDIIHYSTTSIHGG